MIWETPRSAVTYSESIKNMKNTLLPDTQNTKDITQYRDQSGWNQGYFASNQFCE